MSHRENVNRDKCLQEGATVVAAPGPRRRKGLLSLRDDTPLSLFCLLLEEERQVSFLQREEGFPSLTTVSMFEVTSLVLCETTVPREPALSQCLVLLSGEGWDSCRVLWAGPEGGKVSCPLQKIMKIGDLGVPGRYCKSARPKHAGGG